MKKLIIIILLGISATYNTANAQAIEPNYGWSLDRDTISGSTISSQFGSTNMTTVNSPTTNVDAVRGQGITTNGTNQYFGMSSSVVSTNGSWSICYWIKPGGTGVTWGLLSFTSLWDGFFSGGSTLVNARTLAFGSSVTAPNIITGRWNHVCLTKNATTMSAYGNGQASSANPVTITQTPVFTDQRFYFGAANQIGSTDNWWNGTLDDIRIYTREISGGEARMIYYQGVGAHSLNF